MAMQELISAFPNLHIPLSCGFCHRPVTCWERALPATARNQAVGSVHCQGAINSRKSLLPATIGSKREGVEKLWREFFSDPSQWWDHRFDKRNPRFPDFKHKDTQDSLWLDSQLNPPWVETELAAIPPGTLQVNAFSWNLKLSQFSRSGQFGKTMELFQQMQQEGINPDKFTFFPVLSACASTAALEEGRRAHEKIIQTGYEGDVFLGSSLIDMYSKCGSIEEAHEVFNKMPSRDVVAWNAMILGYVKCGESRKGLDLYQQMQKDGVDPDALTFVAVVNACASIGLLEEGRRVHDQIICCGYESDAFVSNCLVDMYSKCENIDDAWKVFKKMPVRDLVSWNTMMLGYVKCGEGWKALELFQQMQHNGLDPDHVTFMAILNACASVEALEEGRDAHEQIIQRGFESTGSVASSLIDMYAKCGSIEDAQRVFEKLPKKDVVVWNNMILGYVKCGQGRKGLELSRLMMQDGVDPDPLTYVALLNACASVGALGEGRCVHEQIIKAGYESDTFVERSLVNMYAKCQSMKDAWSIFNRMPTKDVVSWNAMIEGYVKNGQGQKALELSQQMRHEGVEPNPFTFVVLLNACACLEALEEGKRVHEEIIGRGYGAIISLGSSLIDMYAKCGSLEDAQRVFETMPTRDVVAWTAMILGCVKSREGQKALEHFKQMQEEGVDPDHVTFVAALNACASVTAIEEGRRVHEQIIQRGYESNIFVSNCLVDMYAKCGSIDCAQKVFDKMPTRDVVAWNAMIQGYVKCREGQKALDLFKMMQQEGAEPNVVTFVAVLNACACLATLEEGRCAHEQIVQRGYSSDVFVRSSLVDMYSKCGSIKDAERVFKALPTNDAVAWTAMMMGYVSCGQGEMALQLSGQMQQEGVDPDPLTFVAVLNACASVASLQDGKRAHEQIIQRGYESHVIVSNSLVDMYSKCGSIEDAEKVFNKMPTRDMVSWNAMLAGYGRHGYAREANEHFKRMREARVVDSVTLTSLLSACSHGGLVDEGLGYFESMTAVYNISPAVDHYACVIDLLGRAGHLQEVEDLIKCMPFEPDASLWMSLLGACQVHGNVEMGEQVAKQVLELEPENATGYVLLSNLYTAVGSANRDF